MARIPPSAENLISSLKSKQSPVKDKAEQSRAANTHKTKAKTTTKSKKQKAKQKQQKTQKQKNKTKIENRKNREIHNGTGSGSFRSTSFCDHALNRALNSGNLSVLKPGVACFPPTIQILVFLLLPQQTTRRHFSVTVFFTAKTQGV